MGNDSFIATIACRMKVQVLPTLKRNKSLRIKATSQETVKRLKWKAAVISILTRNQVLRLVRLDSLRKHLGEI